SSGLLSLPQRTYALASSRGCHIAPGHHPGGGSDSPPESVVDGWLAVVSWNSCTSNRIGSGGRSGDGGSLYISAADWGVHSRRVGHSGGAPKLARRASDHDFDGRYNGSRLLYTDYEAAH